jgi:hypothetical protein
MGHSTYGAQQVTAVGRVHDAAVNEGGALAWLLRPACRVAEAEESASPELGLVL